MSAWNNRKVSRPANELPAGFLKSIQLLDPSLLVTAVRVIKNISMNPNILDNLQNCNAIEILTKTLADRHDGPYGNVSDD